MKETELNIIYETRYGSRAYGTDTPESDEDFRGVAVAPKKYYLGYLNHFEQLEQSKPDRIIWDIKKFFKLAADCNPSVIETLFVDDSDIITINSSGEILKENRELFLSKKVRFTFLGYAFSQLRRIRTHRNWLLHPIKEQPTREQFGLPENKTIDNDEQNAFLWLASRMLQGTLEEAKLSEETKKELAETNWIGLFQSHIPENHYVWEAIKDLTGVNSNFIAAMMRERAYANAFTQWHSYQNWQKTRNPARAELEARCGYDTKHAYHLIRLARMGEEILRGQGVIVRRPDRLELLDIRNGSWTYEQVEEWIEKQEKVLEKIYKESPLPNEPDRNKLDQLCQRLIHKELANDWE